MKRMLIPIGMMLFVAMIMPTALGATTILFEDDFSGDLSQWNVTQGDYTIVDGYLRSSIGSTSEAFTNMSFNETDEITFSYRTFGVDTHLISDLFFYINDSQWVDVLFTFGAGEDGLESRLRTREGYTTNLYVDKNYTYVADGEWYYVKMFLNGTDIKFKVWNESDSEPDWRFEGTYTVPLEDGYRIRLYSASLAGGEYVGFDDILLTMTVPDTPYVPIVQQYPLLGIIPLILAIALVLIAVGGAIEGFFDLKMMVQILIVAVLILAFMGVIYTL